MTLTKSGHAVLERADEAASRIESRMRDALSPAERCELKRLLGVCSDAL